MSGLRTFFLVVGLLLACVPWAGAQDTAPARRTIVLACDLEPGTELTARVERFYEAVFAKAGLGVELRLYPVKRGILEAAAGGVDGDFFRVAASGDRFGTLVRVDVPVTGLSYGMYSGREGLPEDTTPRALLDLPGEALRLGRVRGNHNVRTTLEELGVPARHGMVAVADEAQGLRMLARRRLDVLFATDIVVRALLGRGEFADSGIRRLGELGRARGYIYLHRRNADLVPALERALREAHAEGLLAKIVGRGESLDTE